MVLARLQLFAALVALALVGCGDNSNAAAPDAAHPDARELDAPIAAQDRCTSPIAAAAGFVELCAPPNAQPVRRVVITDLQVPATHASAQVVFGFTAAPASATQALGADQLRVLFYGGGPAGPTTIAPIVELDWGAQTETLTGDSSWVNAASTVCFDVYDGSATAAPYVSLWVTGTKGADCADATTLTAASAFGARALWHGAVGPIAKTAPVYYRQADSVTATPSVTLATSATLTESAILAAVSCSSAFAQASTDWQPFCAVAGQIRHVTMTAAASTANNNFFYTVVGQDPAPSGNPTQSANKLIVTGGKSNTGASWTYFRFDGVVAGTGSTTQYSYATDANAALYTDAPSTVCYDLGTDDTTGNLRFVFWATGARGAECATRSTLTFDTALYDSATDVTTGAIWNAPLALDKLGFAKVSGTGATMASVQVSSEPAALP